MTTVLARPLRLDLESFSRAVGLHPDLVVRLVRLGLLDAEVRVDHRLQFASGPDGTRFPHPEAARRPAPELRRTGPRDGSP